MITITELLNKIKWDAQEDPADYTLAYYDRVENTLKEIKLTRVTVEEGFMRTRIDGTDVQIPLHRIKEVKKQGKTIWKRPTTND